MDPNETLRRIRELAAKVATDEYPHDHDAHELAELVTALDEWLTNGNFLPEAWELSPEERAR